MSTLTCPQCQASLDGLFDPSWFCQHCGYLFPEALALWRTNTNILLFLGGGLLEIGGAWLVRDHPNPLFAPGLGMMGLSTLLLGIYIVIYPMAPRLAWRIQVVLLLLLGIAIAALIGFLGYEAYSNPVSFGVMVVPPFIVMIGWLERVRRKK